ncbi:arylsulfatase B-like [Vespa velutina]|uniref:arylsulfatase B-like n=1 Tax=Vespa velutina TaxID=202808 RepID=UPI001FB215B9|nr:arylsulfatase B-like [Vespa velutina]
MMKRRSSNHMTHFSPMVSFFILICGCLLVRSTKVEDSSSFSRPNIIVIIADDLGWNDISFHGADQIPTPNIDALAYNGVILQRNYVLPTCTPSRTAFLTGRYPIRQGMQGYPLKAGEQRAIPKKFKLLPEYLKDLGYSTHLVGKWHVGYYAPEYTPANRGFDTFFGYYNGYIQYFNHTITELQYKKHTGNDLHRDEPKKLSPEFRTGYFTDLITEEAEKIISTHNPAEPLYLQIAHLACHSSGLDNGDELQVPDLNKVNTDFGYIKDMNRRKFAGVLNALDQSVGRVVDALQRAKLLENSIILFTSDNGAQTEGFLENHGSNYPLRGMKFTMFEGGIRVPACIYSPLIRRPSRIYNHLIHITDWLPTLYSAARGNVHYMKDFDGIDQWNTIRKDKRSKRNSLLVNIDDKIGEESAIIGKYKLIKRKTINNGNYYGDDGVDDSYPRYNVTNVMSSLVARAISIISNNKLTEHKIKSLRQSTKISCKHPTDFRNCTKDCLYNIFNDPCETKDISEYYPKIVAELHKYIDGYKKVIVNQTNYPLDRASFPENFNGTWMPWLEDNLNLIPQNYISCQEFLCGMPLLIV